MHTPPFRLAQPSHLKLSGDELAGTGLRVADPCCTPAKVSFSNTKRRARLAELDGQLHCSIIGTCLSTHELRKLVPKFTGLDRRDASDLEIHHSAVELAIDGGAGAKALHKLLDEHYAAAIRRFDKAADGVELIIRAKVPDVLSPEYKITLAERDLQSRQFPWTFQKLLYDCLTDYVVELFAKNPMTG